MLFRYKCRAECFSDICNFFNWIININEKENRVVICNIFCRDIDYSIIFEFDSNIDDFLKIRKLMHTCSEDNHIMYQTLLLE